MLDERSPILDDANAGFICGGISINTAACRPGGFPALARAVGCRVAPDRRAVTVLLGGTAAADVIEGVRRSGAVAVVFSDPSTNRTLQLKGYDALVLPPEPGDAALAARYRAAFSATLVPLGFTDAVVQALLACPDDDLLTIRFSPTAAFSQTPGPQAGEPLVRGA
ncbi:hypothetical protein [Parazoarcus communis]|uniref:Uncharacterized protein n=1 Tax=Parazoarcus communis SWub3 = DSM 12120 TaxID=1121029 RepID=A0A323UTJ4_9RHOO|nr:hypothetical protein [Parazoarcus communis]NMG70517.1 hypothetical protein [Parazoarcus communis SWub3 = DSM 12120]PZA15819.1 hypothetical protein DNK49_15260 [Azoarcus communis] [Parazoarcus communis SWub3 = DSM 12120]